MVKLIKRLGAATVPVVALAFTLPLVTEVVHIVQSLPQNGPLG